MHDDKMKQTYEFYVNTKLKSFILGHKMALGTLHYDV